MYQNQLGIVLILYFFSFIFGSYNYVVFQLANTVFLTIFYYTLVMISDETGHDRLTGLWILIGGIAFLPLLYYTTYVYGTIIGLTLVSGGILFLFRFCKSHKWYYLLFAACLLILALLMKQAKIVPEDRKVVVPANERGAKAGAPAAAIELTDGTIITSETSNLLGTCAALILNATKYLAGIDHKVKLIPKDMIEPIQDMKINYLKGNNPRLHTDEVLVALAMLSPTNENCKKAIEQLHKLNGCQVHTTVMLSEVDRKIFKKLGVNVTMEPVLKKSRRK